MTARNSWIPIGLVCATIVAVWGMYLYSVYHDPCVGLYEPAAPGLRARLTKGTDLAVDIGIGKDQLQVVSAADEKFAMKLRFCCNEAKNGHLDPAICLTEEKRARELKKNLDAAIDEARASKEHTGVVPSALVNRVQQAAEE